ncbi:DNA-binding MarR family transcriptional regulator, partial [Shinella sp. BE166]|uniref:MarR family winged helix-turn-helix transcriptional regulator n=1 Tax=Shinella sp. BE166 TaxID=3373918 RepID=UPI003EC0DEBD
GLAERRQSPADRRVNEVVVTAKGKAMTDKIDVARERIALGVFANWEPADIDDLVRLMRKFADAMEDEVASSGVS